MLCVLNIGTGCEVVNIIKYLVKCLLFACRCSLSSNCLQRLSAT